MTREENGMTFETFCSVIIKQKGKCAICNKIILGKDINVDHNHKTERVRGLLCYKCNYMLGFSEDKPDVLREGARYLDD